MSQETVFRVVQAAAREGVFFWGRGMPLGAACALRARRLAASDPKSAWRPSRGPAGLQGRGGRDKKMPGTLAPRGAWDPGARELPVRSSCTGLLQLSSGAQLAPLARGSGG